MKKNIVVIVALLSCVFGCTSSQEPAESAWSAPVDGLQFQVTSAARFDRNDRGWAMLEVTCAITNSGSNPADITHLARLYVVGEGGATNRCLRSEDLEDLVPACPTVASGQSTSWKQDGQAKIEPGEYDLFAVWDGNMNPKSPSVEIIIE